MGARKLYPNQSARISSSTSTVQNNQVSFLIEGFSNTAGHREFREVSAAVNMAQANHCEYFDPISSYDMEHLGLLLRNKTENEQKAILLGIYLDFVSEMKSADIIECLLKQPYREFFGKIPTWLSSLNPSTIENFITSVLSDMFNGNREGFKIYKLSINAELKQLSDVISARRFMGYVNERPELRTIYGLIGSLHLDMLNKFGEVIAQENYRLVKITINNRVINVHLYGGRHGEMMHYELLAKHAREENRLIVPSAPVESENKDNEELFKFLLLMSSRSYKERISINTMVSKFKDWVTNNVANRNINNEALVDWLISAKGSEYINDYKHFSKFAKALAKQGYDTYHLLSEIEYNAVIKYIKKQQNFEGTMFKMQGRDKEKSIRELTDQFDYWMKNYNHPSIHQENNNRALVDWLYDDEGGEHVRIYKQFCELAKALHKKGYNTNPPPTESEFKECMEKISQKSRYKF